MNRVHEPVQVIHREADRLAHVLHGADPSAPVPTCPGWDAADLLWHLTEVHDMWAHVLGDDLCTNEQVEAFEAGRAPRPASVPEMLALRQDATDRLCWFLASLPDDAVRWTWFDADQSVGFTRRMQVCEATMHRVDAELAAGVPRSRIGLDVAGALVDQCVDVMWGWIPEGATRVPGAVVELHAADTDERWLVQLGRWQTIGAETGRRYDEPFAVRAPAGAEPVASVVAPVVDLALWAWRRGGAVLSTGDAATLAAFTELVERGMP